VKGTAGNHLLRADKGPGRDPRLARGPDPGRKVEATISVTTILSAHRQFQPAAGIGKRARCLTTNRLYSATDTNKVSSNPSHRLYHRLLLLQIIKDNGHRHRHLLPACIRISPLTVSRCRLLGYHRRLPLPPEGGRLHQHLHLTHISMAVGTAQITEGTAEGREVGGGRIDTWHRAVVEIAHC
jgi:hypothetical protein